MALNWNDAYRKMIHGMKIKLPEWGGYWYWDYEKETIIIHTKHGQELDIRATENTRYTFNFILRDDWIAY